MNEFATRSYDVRLKSETSYNTSVRPTARVNECIMKRAIKTCCGKLTSP